TARPSHWLTGVVFSANTLGSVVGALLAGFLLIPFWGIGPALVAGAASFALLGPVLLWVTLPRFHPHWRVGGLLFAAVLVGFFLLPRELTLTRWYDGLNKIRGELLFHREGAFGTVSVFQVGDIKELTINCIEEVPTHRDALLTFKLLGHFPLLLHERPRRVLVNAVGGGITLGAVTRHEVEAEGVDIVPTVFEVLPLFAKENDGVAERKNWRFIADDGRNYLKVTTNTYDVITADATHPAAAESWMLYTMQYYELVKSRLGAGGIFAQWLPLHGLASRDYFAVLKTFHHAFPEVMVLFVNRYSILLGSGQSLAPRLQGIAERMRRSESVDRDLQAVDVVTAGDFLKYIILDSESLKALPLDDIPILTDDLTSVEFAEFNRLGVPAALPAILTQLVPSIQPEKLARQ
ncbi:MAG: spermidine synthase, partial [Candidatus Binatia bacterium]